MIDHEFVPCDCRYSDCSSCWTCGHIKSEHAILASVPISPAMATEMFIPPAPAAQVTPKLKDVREAWALKGGGELRLLEHEPDIDDAFGVPANVRIVKVRVTVEEL